MSQARHSSSKKRVLPQLRKPLDINLSALEETLIRNVYHGYANINLEKEFSGGFSGTRVFLVLPRKPGDTSDARMVTKTGPAEELRREKNNFEAYVKGALPYTGTQVGEYYEQDGQAALNYVFAGGSELGETVSLEAYYSAHPTEDIIQTLRVLLGILGERWYAQSSPYNPLLADEYGRHLPTHEKLEEIVSTIFPHLNVKEERVLIPGVDESFPNPLKVYPTITRKSLEGKRSLVHGDLHLRNVLVDISDKAWLIDFAKVTERHNLFDFIKLETYIRLMALAAKQGAFSLQEYAQFEAALCHNTSAPANPVLSKAYEVIQAIRQMAQNYLRAQHNFKGEYLMGLFVYCLAMMKYYRSNGPVPTQLIFVTTCVLGQFVFESGESPVLKQERDNNKPVATTQRAQKPISAHAFDVFISYSHFDKDWVQTWLLQRLEKEGLRVCIDSRDFKIGVPSLTNMEWAVDNSSHTLLVLTPAWVQSAWTEFESILIQTTDPAGRQRRLLPLMLKPCVPPSRIAILNYADFTQPKQREIQLSRLIEAIRGVSSQPPVVKPAPPRNFSEWNTAIVRQRLTMWIRKHFVAMSVGVLLVVGAIPLGQQVWQANRVEQALEAGVCLILASLIFLLSLLLLQGKGSGKEPEGRNKPRVKQPGEAPGYFKRLRNRVARLNKKSLIAFWGMGILGLLLTTISGITQVTFKSYESKCLSVKVSPSLLLNIPVGIGGTGIGKPVDPLQGSTVIPLSREQISNLTNLSGQPILTGSTADCTCNWRVSVNNAAPAPIASSSCTFSIPLPQKEQATSISLWLEIGSNTELFNMWGLTARKQTKIFNIQVK